MESCDTAGRDCEFLIQCNTVWPDLWGRPQQSRWRRLQLPRATVLFDRLQGLTSQQWHHILPAPTESGPEALTAKGGYAWGSHSVQGFTSRYCHVSHKLYFTLWCCSWWSTMLTCCACCLFGFLSAPASFVRVWFPVHYTDKLPAAGRYIILTRVKSQHVKRFLVFVCI